MAREPLRAQCVMALAARASPESWSVSAGNAMEAANVAATFAAVHPRLSPRHFNGGSEHHSADENCASPGRRLLRRTVSELRLKGQLPRAGPREVTAFGGGETSLSGNAFGNPPSLGTAVVSTESHYEVWLSTVTARRFCDQQEISLHTATGLSLPYEIVCMRSPDTPLETR